MIFAMHIAEGFLPPLWVAVWTLAAAPFVILGFRSLGRAITRRPDQKLPVAASGAFCFVLSAMKIPSVTGSCSHPTGVGLGTALVGPWPMMALGSMVLLFQALLLAHGGITTLGANIFSMAVVGPLVAWWVLRAGLATGLRWSTAGGVAAGVSSLTTYVVTAVQLALAHPDPASGVAGSVTKFLGIFAITQLPLSVIEGLVTSLALGWLASRSTVALPGWVGHREAPRRSLRGSIAVLAAVVVLLVAPLVARRGAEWAGADSRAADEVTAIDSDYEPWFESWWSPPSGEIEGFLFALQAAVGAAVLGYVVGARHKRLGDGADELAPSETL